MSSEKAHPGMRVPAKTALHNPRDRPAQAGKRVPGPGDRLDEIEDPPRDAVELNDKTLLALLDVKRGSGVQEAEAFGCVDGFGDSAQVQRPQAYGAGLNSNERAGRDTGLWVRYAHPAEVELLPALERAAGAGKILLASPDF